VLGAVSSLARAIMNREGDSCYSLWDILIAEKVFLETNGKVNGSNFRCPTRPQGNPYTKPPELLKMAVI